MTKKNIIFGLVAALVVMGLVMPAMADQDGQNGVGNGQKLKERVKAVLNGDGNGAGQDGTGPNNAKGVKLGQRLKDMRNVLRPVLSGIGFAISGDEYHVVQARVVRLRNIDPAQVREMMAQNLTNAEIKERLLEISDFAYKGKLVFAGTPYNIALDKQSVEEDDGNRTRFSGNVTTLPAEDGSTQVVGTIDIEVRSYEKSRVVVGALSIDGREYDLFLNGIGAEGLAKNAGAAQDKMLALRKTLQQE